jgi:hypothetical protein
MPQICHRCLTKKKLGLLDEQFVGAEQLEDELYLLHVFLPRRAIDVNIIKKTRTNLRRNDLRMSFIRAWNVAGPFVNPKWP